jgi:hypothetical protein
MIGDEMNARDLEIINRRADYLNKEAADVLSYQATCALLYLQGTLSPQKLQELNATLQIALDIPD